MRTHSTRDGMDRDAVPSASSWSSVLSGRPNRSSSVTMRSWSCSFCARAACLASRWDAWLSRAATSLRFRYHPEIRLSGADEALSLQRESELRFPEVSTHLFRCLPDCVDDLVLCLGIIQPRLQKHRPGVEFLGCSRIGLGTE